MKFYFVTQTDAEVLDRMYENWTEAEMQAIGHCISDVSHYGYKKGVVRGAIAATVGIMIGVALGHGAVRLIEARNKKQLEEN